MGLPGIVIGALGFWCNRLQQKLEESQTKRVEDAQKMAGMALDLKESLDKQTDLLMEIKGGKR